MENAEEILQCLDEFSKLRPKEIPPELEYYLSFVARTGDPVYQWPLIKCLFREKLVNVITEFYEACPSVEIPPCPNVEIFNYEAMKGFILEKLDTFAAAPFTVQRICELLTSPRKEYNRIDKYMRALEKNILVVSTREPGNRKSTENGESVVNGLESEHGSQEMVNSLNSDINVEVDMDEKTVWHKSYAVNESSIILESHTSEAIQIQESYVSDSKSTTTTATRTEVVAGAAAAAAESVITTRHINIIGYAHEMLVEPSTTIGNSEEAAPPLPDNSGVPAVFGLSRTDKEDEQQMYVATEEGAFLKAADMDTSQVAVATDTEPITPPEPEKAESSAPQEAVVESSSETTTPAAAATTTTTTITPKTEDKEVASSNETTITSSDEMPQSSTEAVAPEHEDAEVSASDHQEVTESNLIIGPEDMQVEDISPEPEAQAELEADVPETGPQEARVCEEAADTPATPETPAIPEMPESSEDQETAAERGGESSVVEDKKSDEGSGGGERVELEEVVKATMPTETERERETERETETETESN